jgi:hypothetical protein
MEYPELAGPGRIFDPEHPEMKSREAKMRIGEVGLVPKSVMPTQAADLLAYLVGASLRPPIHPVFDGILDGLLPRKRTTDSSRRAAMRGMRVAPDHSVACRLGRDIHPTF